MSKKYPMQSVYVFVCAVFVSAAVLFFAGCQDSDDTDKTAKIEEPSEPEQPGKKDNPATPDMPKDPVKPDNPATPETPKDPVKPDNPEVLNQAELNGVEALKSYLAGMPENMETNPYSIKLSGFDLSSTNKTGNTLRTLYDALTHYVSLDLKGCTGETIPNITAKTAPNKKKIISLILPETVTTINRYAFTDCDNLRSVEMPKVTIIMAKAFSGLTKLESVSMPEVRTLEDIATTSSGVFYKCTALASVSMPKIDYIGNNAFNNCSSLISITLGRIPPTLGGADAFKNAKSLSWIYIPADALNTYKNTDKEHWDKLKDKVTTLP
ncbi:MAG: leucine-rich repeat protein [Treponema sp.]|jgi:hypothetical protein|nr:leucine-rich repeat protein [Treponema sp.]